MYIWEADVQPKKKERCFFRRIILCLNFLPCGPQARFRISGDLPWYPVDWMKISGLMKYRQLHNCMACMAGMLFRWQPCISCLHTIGRRPLPLRPQNTMYAGFLGPIFPNHMPRAVPVKRKTEQVAGKTSVSAFCCIFSCMPAPSSRILFPNFFLLFSFIYLGDRIREAKPLYTLPTYLPTYLTYLTYLPTPHDRNDVPTLHAAETGVFFPAVRRNWRNGRN